MQVNWDEVKIGPLTCADFENFVQYWHDPKNTFLDELGVDRRRLPSAKKMREQLALNIENDSRLNTTLAISFHGKTIGVHELTDLKIADTAVMHAHLWTNQHRGKGIGPISYLKAMQEYFFRFELNTIEFKTPKNNYGANKIKEKLGIVACSECEFFLPILKAPVPAIYYVVTAKNYSNLVSKFRGQH